MCEECHVRVQQRDQKCDECWDEAEEARRDQEFDEKVALGYV